MTCLAAVQDKTGTIGKGQKLAHAGILAAAVAIWKDLREHRILPALLNMPQLPEPVAKTHEFDIGASGSQKVCCAAAAQVPV